MSPRVSICIPCYNNAGQMRRLLRSIGEQTYTDYEVVIADDSTNDEIAHLVAEWAGNFPRRDPENPVCAKNCGAEPAQSCGRSSPGPDPTGKDRKGLPHVNYVHNEKPLGHIYNWNAALDPARGDLIKIMFSDDWFTFPDSLARMVALLDENPAAVLAFSGSRQTPLPPKDAEDTARAPWDRAARPEFIEELRKDYRYLFTGDEIGAPSATLYRACGARFDPRSSWASDMVLYFEILSSAAAAADRKENAAFSDDQSASAEAAERRPERPAGPERASDSSENAASEAVLFAFTPEPLISIGIHEEQYTERFDDRDPRKYADDRLMYDTFGLRGNEICRRRMLFQNVKYRKGWQEAKACGASLPEYLRQRLSWFYTNTILGYWGGLKNRLRSVRQKASG